MSVMADAAGVRCNSKRKLLSTAGDGTLILLFSLHASTTHYPLTFAKYKSIGQCLQVWSPEFNLLSWSCCQKEVMAASGANDHATRQLSASFRINTTF